MTNFSVPTSAFPSFPAVTGGVASSALSCPNPVLAASGGPQTGHADAAITAPAAKLTGYFSSTFTPFAAPSPTLYATGRDSTGDQAADLTAPRPTLAAYAGANAALAAPRPALSAAATVTGCGAASIKPPSPHVSATGTVSATGSFGPYVGAPRPNLVGYGGAVCSITLTGRYTLDASGTTGGVGAAAVVCPMFELVANGTAQGYGGAELLAPSPRMGATLQAYLIAPSARLSAIGSAMVTATYEAYAVNLNHAPSDQAPVDEVTHYTNFPFTHVVRYQNSYFGVASDGLYLLEGTTDDGHPIAYDVKTCAHDFGATQKKTLVSAYLGARFGPTATVSVYAGEKNPEVYSYTTPRDTRAQNHRQVFGRGVKERYLALGVSGTDAMELDSIEFEIATMSRRI